MAFHFSSSSPSSLQSHNFLFLLHPSVASPLSLLNGSLKSAAWTSPKRKSFGLTCRSSINDDEDYLLDAPVSIGDGFSFSGGKYSDGPNPADEWVSRGKIVKAHPVFGAGKKAKDPIFGLAMGGGSQTSDDNFRWFCIESGSVDNPPIVLIHGFPSQAYSYRKVLPVLSKDYHAIGFDWLERERQRPRDRRTKRESRSSLLHTPNEMNCKGRRNDGKETKMGATHMDPLISLP